MEVIDSTHALHNQLSRSCDDHGNQSRHDREGEMKENNRIKVTYLHGEATFLRDVRRHEVLDGKVIPYNSSGRGGK